MIANEQQYSITKAELGKFKASLAVLEQQKTLTLDFNDRIRHQLHLDALNSQIESFREEIEQYDRSKNVAV